MNCSHITERLPHPGNFLDEHMAKCGGRSVLELLSRHTGILGQCPLKSSVKTTRRPDWTGPQWRRLSPPSIVVGQRSQAQLLVATTMSSPPGFLSLRLSNNPASVHPTSGLCSGTPASAPHSGGDSPSRRRRWCSARWAPPPAAAVCLPCREELGEAPGAGSCSSSWPSRPAILPTQPCQPCSLTGIFSSSSRVKSLPQHFPPAPGGRSRGWRAPRLALTSGEVCWPQQGGDGRRPSRGGRWDQAPWPESVQLAKQGELPRQTAEV